MKNLLILLLLAGAGGAAWKMWPPPPEVRHEKTVWALDLTASIEKGALADEFAAAERGPDFLSRGDELVVVPVTSDAVTEAPGKILRFLVPTKRKAFDSDLRAMKKQVRAGLEAMRDESAAKPFGRTDLLGTFFKLAAEEAPKGGGVDFRVVALGDMIQDTAELNFTADPRLANEASARKLAASLMNGRENLWAGARVFLGLLRSEDLRRLAPARREAVRAFWLEFFGRGGAAEVVWATDGAGRLDEFLRRRGGGEAR